VNIVSLIIILSTRTRTKTTFNNINTPAASAASFNNYNKLLFGYRCNGIEKMIIGEVLMPLHFNYYYCYYYCLIDDISYVLYDVLQSGAF
jgi:hypothetical protein